MDYMPQIIGAGTALAGVLIGGWISSRNQRRQWVLDNRKAEYRELLEGLFKASEDIIKARPNIAAGMSPELIDAIWRGQRLLRNRIFIAQEIQAGGIPQDWEQIANLAYWEPSEAKPEIHGTPWAYTTNGIISLRNELDKKLLAVAQRDMGLRMRPEVESSP
jgi:hypothetical protein